MAENRGFDMHFQFASRDAEKLMNQIEARGKKLPMKRVKVIAIRSILRNFQEGGRPEKWAPIARDGRPLQDTGNMKKLIEPTVLTARELKIEATAPYAPYHQFGTKQIVARPFVLWQKEDIRLTVNMLADYLWEG